MRRSLTIIAALVTLSSCFNFGSAPSGDGGIRTNTLQTYEESTPQYTGIQAMMEMPLIKKSDDILQYNGYVSSYNTETLIPDWVAYELVPSELEGDADRNDHVFSMDMSFKKAQAMREDYRDSGWTKGHMAPAADFAWSDDAMGDTFLFMNCCPQNEYLNRKDWEYLERQVRRWAGEFGKVWVVTGPVVGSNKYGTIGDRGVVVPDSFFKAVLVQSKGKYHSIAFMMDNDSSRQYLYDCSLTVNELEEETGIDFFPNLDDGLEDAVEGQLDRSFWGIRKK